MDIDVFGLRNNALMKNVIEYADIAPLLNVLRDPSETLTMGDREFIAGLLDKTIKLPQARPKDQNLKSRVIVSYIAYLRCISQGDQETYAYDHAAKATSQCVKTVKKHVKEILRNDTTEWAMHRMTAEAIAKIGE